jgi:hypothetical protein
MPAPITAAVMATPAIISTGIGCCDSGLGVGVCSAYTVGVGVVIGEGVGV